MGSVPNGVSPPLNVISQVRGLTAAGHPHSYFPPRPACACWRAERSPRLQAGYVTTGFSPSPGVWIGRRGIWATCGAGDATQWSRRWRRRCSDCQSPKGTLEFGHSSHHTPCDEGLDAPACPHQVHFSDFALHSEPLPRGVKCNRDVLGQAGLAIRRDDATSVLTSSKRECGRLEDGISAPPGRVRYGRANAQTPGEPFRLVDRGGVDDGRCPSLRCASPSGSSPPPDSKDVPSNDS